VRRANGFATIGPFWHHARMSASRLINDLHAGLARLTPGGIVVGFSGGLDSSVLLHALSALAPARERGLRALHVDHGLHAGSAEWCAHCSAFARQLGVPFIAATAAVTTAGKGLEEAARAARYRVFAEHLQPGESLALAHHADDQAETVLLKLLRGAGPQGLGAMRALRDFNSGYLWRPLLNLPRELLRDYAQAHGLHWIEDPSNRDTYLRRNFLRAEILPRLTQRWPDATVAIAHSAAWAQAAADFVDDHAQRALAQLQAVNAATSPKGASTLPWRGWLELPDALRDPVLRLWLRAQGFDEPAHFHVAELERQLRMSADDRAPCVRWNQCELRRYRELLHAMRPLAPVAADWQAVWDGSPLALPGGGTLALHGEGGSATTVPADRPLTIHYRNGGEHIKPAGTAHTRELRLLLQEAGIPPWQRDRIPLISMNSELIAVGDLFLSAAAVELCARIEARIMWENREV
jgi:tRNA(Ile)-lysidine synthase